MKTWIITGIATVVLLGLGGYLINNYGISRYDTGKAECRADNLESVATINEINARELERIRNETNRLSDNDLDLELFNLGIMRDYSDR